MKYLLLLSFFVLNTSTETQQRYCSLHGSVYITKDRALADFIVYKDTEAFSDFLVYEEENRLYATEEGIWFFVENRGLADFSVYFTNSKSQAHFTMAFTDSPTFAGCD